ncbi:MAG: flagellar biosynthesis protein FlhA [Peptococcaceae bacterium]|nr:flagellar biosynthesis protein FlhA [Peptococcaceae bacterium]
MASTPLTVNTAKSYLYKSKDMIIAGLVVGIILMIIIPLSPAILDVLLVCSMTFALVILLITMFTVEPLQFAVFPTLLLVTTLLRLALNIAATRLILGQAHAGEVIHAFGTVVVGGSYVVGMVIFIIITVVQFVVITNGASRVAEVAARFTLDAMPGKQMSIDAEFNAGMINETEARDKRKRLQREADFFGAMDGASKFVRGDAIAGIVIILICIIGGFIIGIVQKNMGLVEALQTYTLLTIGEGLVAQIPALLISTATGILVTRATSEASFGQDISTQFTNFPKVMIVAALVLLVIGMVPAMPSFWFLMLASILGYAAFSANKAEQVKVEEIQEQEVREIQEQRKEPENVSTFFQVDAMEVEIGYNLILLTDEGQGGDLLHRLAAVRRQCAREMGIYVRPIRIRDNLQLNPNGYTFKIRGVDIAAGELAPGQFLAMDPLGQDLPIRGTPTKEPTFGLPAWWVSSEERDQVEMAGLTVVDCATVMVTHLTEIIKRHAHELLGRQEVKELLDVVKEKNAVVVDELVPELLALGEVQKILQNLLKERVPIKDMATILESLADASRISKDSDYLTECVRQTLARTICSQYISHESSKIVVATLHPRLEQIVSDSIEPTQMGAYPVMEPQLARQMLQKLKEDVEFLAMRGASPVLLCSSKVRLPLRRLTERLLPQLAVLSMNEIASNVEVEVIRTVTLDED